MLSMMFVKLLLFQVLFFGRTLTSPTNSKVINKDDPKTRLECIDDGQDMWWHASPPWSYTSGPSGLPGILRNKFDPTTYGIWYKEGPGNLFVLTDLKPYVDIQPMYLYVRYYTQVHSDLGHAIAFPSFPADADDGDHYKYLSTTQDFVWGQTLIQLDPSFIERGYQAGIGELSFDEDEYFVVEKIILAQGFNLTTNDKAGELFELCGWEEIQAPSTSTTTTTTTSQPPELTTPESEDFTCTAVGTFPDPQNCQVFHICQLLDSGEFWDSEISCPDFTVFCEASGVCESPVKCPCKNTV